MKFDIKRPPSLALGLKSTPLKKFKGGLGPTWAKKGVQKPASVGYMITIHHQETELFL